MSKPRLFLLLVVSPSLEAEHARVRDAVQFHSDGDFTEVFKQAAALPGAKATGAEIPFTVGYLFSTTTHPGDMGFGILDRDRMLLIEVTSFHREAGLSVAGGWLDRHRVRD